MRTFTFAMFLTLAVCITTPALAGNWVVDTGTSSLTFAGTQAGAAFKGEFKRFIADITFDEAKLDTSRIQITVDMKSATTDDHDQQEALPTKDWFSSAEFPNAEFTSSSITKTGEHQFAAAGKLTIRGVSRDVTLPFTLTPEGKGVVADGTLELNRRDYGIGQGRWADDKWIAFPVTVHYVIHAGQ